MKKTIITKVYRGDQINIPIVAELVQGATYRAQLRRTPEDLNYFTLLIDGSNIVITSPQSFNLVQGTWYADLEENKEGVITTVQKTSVVIKNDITKTYGEPATEWQTEQSVEVAELIAKDLYFRRPSGELVAVGAGGSGSGMDGLSAYEVAVVNGFVGTESEWLDSLIGTDGLNGTNGTNGLNGSDGADGYTPIKGIDYFDGNNGSDGSNGLDGADGLSAYQIWLNLGNTGTEQDFIDSLKGADGADGSGGSGSGDMLAAIYDPTNKAADAFNMDSMNQGSTNKFVTASEKTAITHTNRTALDSVTGVNTGDQDLSNLVTKEAGKGLSTNDFTTIEKTKLSGIEAGAEVNNISDVNATALTGGGSITLHKHSYNNLDNLPTIPDQLSDLTEDSTHRIVTDAEKSTWTNKQAALGFTPENIANKGANNGYAGLDSGGKIALSNLPALTADNISDTSTTNKFVTSTEKTAITHSNRTALDNVSGTNTGDETTATIKTKLGITTLSGSNTGDQDLSDYSLNTHIHSGTVKQVLIDNTQHTNWGNTTENTVYTGTIPANSVGINGSFHITALIGQTSNANAKTVRVKFNNVIVCWGSTVGCACYQFYGIIRNRASLSSQVMMYPSSAASGAFASGTSGAITTTSINTGANITVTVTIQNATSTDNTNLEAIEIWATQ